MTGRKTKRTKMTGRKTNKTKITGRKAKMTGRKTKMTGRKTKKATVAQQANVRWIEKRRFRWRKYSFHDYERHVLTISAGGKN